MFHKLKNYLENNLFNCFLLTVISFSSIFAQKLTTSSTYLKRTVNLNENIDHWKASVQSMQMTSPGGSSYNDFLITQKKIQIISNIVIFVLHF